MKSQRSNHTQTSPVTQQRWLSYTETPVEVIKSLYVPFLSFVSFINFSFMLCCSPLKYLISASLL